MIDKAATITIERQRFMTCRMMHVLVKSAPWCEGERRFGHVNFHQRKSPTDRLGPVTVHILGAESEQYASLDAMLEHWIGD